MMTLTWLNPLLDNNIFLSQCLPNKCNGEWFALEDSLGVVEVAGSSYDYLHSVDQWRYGERVDFTFDKDHAEYRYNSDVAYNFGEVAKRESHTVYDTTALAGWYYYTAKVVASNEHGEFSHVAGYGVPFRKRA